MCGGPERSPTGCARRALQCELLLPTSGALVITPESSSVAQRVATGALPEWAEVEALTTAAHARYRDVEDGTVADYIPLLAAADPSQFGLCVAECAGSLHAAGDAAHRFSLQSVSKAFVYALVCHEYGHADVKERVGVNNTGLSFNSVIALELNDGHPMNPMVNAGAIATTALMPGGTPAGQWELIRSGMSAFAGRQLTMDAEVYASEMATNQRNRAIASLLVSYGRLDTDPFETVDLYTRQCALLVDARDLAVMGRRSQTGV